LGLALIRRAVRPKEDRLKTKGRDVYALVLVSVIVLSGFLLESVKIPSEAAFNRMMEDYADADGPGEMQALKAYWVAEYGLTSSEPHPPASAETLAAGREIHEMNCAACHSRPQSAFLSYPLSRVFAPAARFLDDLGAATALYYIHFLSCFVGLAGLAFSKMWHLVATPVSLVVAATSDPALETKASTATRKMIEQDGCEPCAVCRPECPVRIRRDFRTGGVRSFEPSEDLAAGRSPTELGGRPGGGPTGLPSLEADNVG
jgi:hypothetical protein